MKSISRDPIPYICEADRDLPQEEQTIFWVTPKNGQMAAASTRRYYRVMDGSGDSQREYNERKGLAADIEEFQSIVTKVENFFFSAEYLQKRPNLDADENGAVKEIVDPNIFADLVRSELASNVLQEIFGAASDPVKLDRGAKKG